MSIYLNLFILAVCICWINDLSGFVDEMTARISSFLTHGKRNEPFYRKPWTCSTCQITWIGLIYIIVVGELSFFTFGYTLLLGFLAPHITDVLNIVSNALSYFANKINNIFEKKNND